MKTKNKLLLMAAAAVAVLAVTQTGAAKAGPNDRDLPSEDDLFWRVTSSMNRPDDTTACQAAIDAISTADLLAYANAHPREGEQQGGPQGGQMNEQEESTRIKQGFYQMCTMIAQMPTEMQAGMTADGASTNLFGMSDWHHASGLYFQKAGKGKISFTNTLDFLSYRFFRFMNNFDNMVEMDDGYISVNATMVDDIKNYGAQLTMYGLNLGSDIPDIYVDGQLAGANDVGDITYNATEGSLTFTAKHFSSYRAVAKGSSVKAMTIKKISNHAKVIRYSAHKNTFLVKIKGKNLKPASGKTLQCTLGFEEATKVSVSKNGKSAICVFPMSYFSDKGTFPLTLSIDGQGEVTKTSAVRIR